MRTLFSSSSLLPLAMSLLGASLTGCMADGSEESELSPVAILAPIGARAHAPASPPGGEAVGEASEAISQTNGILYHNGPVMRGTVHIYYIWYGSWAGATTTPTILTDFAQHIGGSPYLWMNATYDDTIGPVTGAAQYLGSTTDGYSRGTTLTQQNVRDIVADAITSTHLPSDPNGVYFVLTSSDVTATLGTDSFCNNFCGYHSSSFIGGADIKYSFVGDGARCPLDCTRQPGLSPNGNVGADGMASVIAHELSEAITDPDISAWFNFVQNNSVEENADKCADDVGNTYTVANGSNANVALGTRNYLLQLNWINAGGGYCSIDRASMQDWGYADRRFMADFNGDGRDDFCRAGGTSSGPGSYLACNLGTSSGYFGAIDRYLNVDDWGYADRRWMADINGDGTADFCRATGNSSGAGSFLRCSLSNGISFTSDVYLPVSDWGYSDRRWLVDVNGDGKADYCRAGGAFSGAGSYLRCSLSNGSAFTSDIFPGVSDWGYADRRWMADFNGDGKADLCRAVGNTSGAGSFLRCSLSNGNGFSSDVTGPVSDWGYADRRWMADTNGDGKADLCRATGTSSGPGSGMRCSLSNGAGFSSDTVTNISDWGYSDRRFMAAVFNTHASYCRAIVENSGTRSYLSCQQL